MKSPHTVNMNSGVLAHDPKDKIVEKEARANRVFGISVIAYLLASDDVV